MSNAPVIRIAPSAFRVDDIVMIGRDLWTVVEPSVYGPRTWGVQPTAGGPVIDLTFARGADYDVVRS
jgi:hypothetical protein